MAWTLSKVGKDVLKLDDGVNDPSYLNWHEITLDVNGENVKISQHGVVHDGVDQIVIDKDDFASPTGTAIQIVEAVSGWFGTKGATAWVNTIAASISSVQVAAANQDRKTLTVVNTGVNNIYVKYGTAASLTSYTHRLTANDSVVIDDYNGVVHAIWDVAVGDAIATEVTS